MQNVGLPFKVMGTTHTGDMICSCHEGHQDKEAKGSSKRSWAKAVAQRMHEIFDAQHISESAFDYGSYNIAPICYYM